jgi:hypothetical protein
MYDQAEEISFESRINTLVPVAVTASAAPDTKFWNATWSGEEPVVHVSLPQLPPATIMSGDVLVEDIGIPLYVEGYMSGGY